jgi:hypothetical protein
VLRRAWQALEAARTPGCSGAQIHDGVRIRPALAAPARMSS